MVKKTSNRLAYGLTIMVFGLLFLLKETGVLDKIPYCKHITNIGFLVLIAGIIFLCTKAEKNMGIIFTAVGVIISSNFLFGWMHDYSNLIIPVIFICVGGLMVLKSK